MENTATYPKETYLKLLHDLQMFSAIKLIPFFIEHDLEPSAIPIPSVVYIDKIDVDDQLTPLAYLDTETDNPKIICMRFQGDEPSFACFGLLEFLDEFTPLTKENHSKLSIVPQANDTKA